MAPAGAATAATPAAAHELSSLTSMDPEVTFGPFASFQAHQDQVWSALQKAWADASVHCLHFGAVSTWQTSCRTMQYSEHRAQVLSALDAMQVANVADMQLSSTARTPEPPCDDAPGSPSVAAILAEAAQARRRTGWWQPSIQAAAMAEDAQQRNGAGGAQPPAAPADTDAATTTAVAGPLIGAEDGSTHLDVEHAAGVVDMHTAAAGTAEPGGGDSAGEADPDSMSTADLPAQKRQRPTP